MIVELQKFIQEIKKNGNKHTIPNYIIYYYCIIRERIIFLEQKVILI